MGYDLARLGEARTIEQLDEWQAGLVVTARMWVVMRKRGVDPAEAMGQRLGSSAAAWHFWLLMEEVGTAWPDPFLVSPPCCRTLNHDEALLVDMIGDAAGGERMAFLTRLRDMLPVELADRLFTTTRSFLTALTQPATAAG